MIVKQPLLQSSVSHDSSGIILICWFAAQETLISSAEIYIFWCIESSKGQYLVEIEFKSLLSLFLLLYQRNNMSDVELNNYLFLL